MTDVARIVNITHVAERVKLSHVAEIVKLTHVARILEACSMYDHNILYRSEWYQIYLRRASDVF